MKNTRRAVSSIRHNPWIPSESPPAREGHRMIPAREGRLSDVIAHEGDAGKGGGRGQPYGARPGKVL